ncbi:MAG: hypothetical protein D6772_16415, partial [Bacteroidetes bacterium]
MTKTKQILLTLRPTDYYFFGGEQTFDDSQGTRNYYVRSRHLPQQTAVVGLLRHMLLLAGADFGPSSFDPDFSADTTGRSHQTFGRLHSVSPLFLQYKTASTRNFLLPAPKLSLENKAEIAVNYAPSTTLKAQGWQYGDRLE